MDLGTIFAVLVVLLTVGALPIWPYSRGWGYAPGGILAAVLVILLALLLLDRI